MKKNNLKYFLTIIILMLNVVPVLADDNVVDFSRKGSISITLSETNSGEKVVGADIAIYKIADAYANNYNLAFDYEDILDEYQENLDNGIISNDLLEIVVNNDLSNFSGKTDENGVVSFENLDLGLYLVNQVNKVDGYSKIEPFLVMIPQIQENKWIYDVEAVPKVDIIRLFDLSVEKVWNVSSGVSIPNEVTVELLKGDVVIDTIVLNKENNWSYLWKQIEKKDNYSVREVNVPDGYTVTYRQDGNQFIITNTKKLAQTGQFTWVVTLLATLGILLILVGIILNKRNRYE